MNKSKSKRGVRRWDKTFPKKKADPLDSPSPAPASLPLLEDGQSLPATIPPDDRPLCGKCGTKFLKKRDHCSICGEWHPDKLALSPGLRLPDDSPQRPRALQMVAMREAGLSDDQIALALGVTKNVIQTSIYRAGKNGWLDFADPKNQLEYQLMHKVVRNLDEALDDEFRNEKTGMAVKTAVALQMAEGALYPKLQANQGPAQTTIVGVKVEIVGGTATEVREGTVMGSGSYVDAETDE